MTLGAKQRATARKRRAVPSRFRNRLISASAGREGEAGRGAILDMLLVIEVEVEVEAAGGGGGRVGRDQLGHGAEAAGPARHGGSHARRLAVDAAQAGDILIAPLR